MKARIALCLSVAMNILLLLAFRPLSGSRPEHTASVATPVVAQPAPPAGVHKEPSAAPPAYKFHWAELDSSDFATYIGRLRGVGCPESTIAAIVQSELGEIFAEKRHQMEVGTGRAPTLTQLRKLEQEQRAVFDSLLPQASLVGSTAGNPNQDAGIPHFQPSVRSPLSSSGGFEGLVTNAAGYGSAARTAPSGPAPRSSVPESQVLAQITQGFVNDIGGPGQNPADPQYRARWSKAQRTADDRLRALYGAQYYNAYQLAVGTKAYQEASGTK